VLKNKSRLQPLMKRKLGSIECFISLFEQRSTGQQAPKVTQVICGSD